MIRRFIQLTLLALALLVSVPSTAYTQDARCKSGWTTEGARAKVFNDGPVGTKFWKPAQDQKSMDRLKDAFNKVPPQAFHIDEVDELDLYTFPGNKAILYVLSLDGCAVGIGMIDPKSLINLLQPQGTTS